MNPVLYRPRGFTIVELLVVIVVIAILAAISIVAYNGIQTRARNSERQMEISNIQKSLENFYTINGRYPTVNEMRTDPVGTFGINESGLKDPSANAIINYCSSNNGQYCYIPFTATGVGGCGYTDSTQICVRYLLIYRPEPFSSNVTLTNKQGEV